MPLSLLCKLLLLLVSLLPSALSSCDLLIEAFRSVSNFNPPATPCPSIRELRLPSQNLTGTVSWAFLRNITALHSLDLSGNSLHGSVPGGFWSSPALAEVNLAHNRLGGSLRFEPSPALRSLNLSRNRFTSAAGFAGLRAVQVLDLSHNGLGFIPPDLAGAKSLRYLDLSFNSLAGEFPTVLDGLRFLNVSYNNLTGRVSPQIVKKFGRSAFVKAGASLTLASSARAADERAGSKEKKRTPEKKRKKRVHRKLLGIIVAASVVTGLVILGGLLWFLFKRKAKNSWEEEKERVAAAAEGKEARWVAEARWGAPVVVFDKPLMELTFADLAAATSGFSSESQLTEGGRSGPAYRAVLAGDMHVVVRLVESARGVEELAAAAAFRLLAQLRHPNLLPLLGYCIAGREKLLLYEYMERGDLHRWLHELPAGRPDVEDSGGDTWEQQQVNDRSSPASWPARHRIALGMARGLAFLHQGWVGSRRRPVVHGHLAASKVLLDHDLEPRIAVEFGAVSGEGGAAAEGDVYGFGVVVMELVTGREGWSEVDPEMD